MLPTPEFLLPGVGVFKGVLKGVLKGKGGIVDEEVFRE